MKDILKSNKLKIILTLIFAILLLMNITISSYADEIRVGISPSKIVDYQLQQGESKDITFKVANSSVFPKEHTEKYDLYEFEIEVDAILEDSYGIEIDSSEIISFDKTIINCKPDEVKEVTMTISIPDNFEKNDYKIYVSFKRNPLTGIEDSTNNLYSVMKAPIYMYVGNKEDFEDLKVEYGVEEFQLEISDDYSSILDIVSDYLLKIIQNPLSISDIFKDILNRPIYVVENEEIILDINNDILTDLIEVSTDKKLNDWAYVSVCEKQLSQKVDNINFGDDYVEFILESNDKVIVESIPSTTLFIKNQINNLLPTIEGSPVLNDLFKSLKAPINKNYEIFNPHIYTDIKNQGDRTIHVGANISLLKDNVDVVGSAELMPLSVEIDKSESISVPLKIDNYLIDGDYKLVGEFKGADIEEVVNSEFSVDTSIRIKVFISVVSMLLVNIAVFIYIIKKAISMKKIK